MLVFDGKHSRIPALIRNGAFFISSRNLNCPQFWLRMLFAIHTQYISKTYAIPIQSISNAFAVIHSFPRHLCISNIDADYELNNPITEDEIKKAIKALKNGKARGIDNIVNQHIKYSYPLMKDTFIKLFNIVFDTGIIPESWTIGIINPIYKN